MRRTRLNSREFFAGCRGLVGAGGLMAMLACLAPSALPAQSDRLVAEERFPVTIFKADDIVRARQNIEQFAWARSTYQALKERADRYLPLDDEELRGFVPRQTPFITIKCPECGAGPWYWVDLIDDGLTLRCRADGTTFDYDPTVTTEEWDIHGLFRYMRLEYILLDLENLGIVYQVEGAREYAEKARPVILEFARAYPNYRVNRVNDNVFAENDDYHGKIGGWKWRDALLVGRVLLTFDLIRDSGVFTADEIGEIEFFLRYTLDHYLEGFGGERLAKGRFPQDQGSVWWSIAALGALLGDEKAMRLVVEAYEDMMDPDFGLFQEDGSFYQRTPTYNWGLLGAIAGIPEVLRGNISPAVYDNPKCALLELCYAWFLDALYPDGTLPAWNDSHVGLRPDPLASEIAYSVYQNPQALMHLKRLYGENLSHEIVLPKDESTTDGLTGFLVDRGGLNRYGLFFRDPGAAVSDIVEPYSIHSRHFSGQKVMIMRDDRHPPRTATGILNYQQFLRGAHMQPDYLSISLYSNGLEMVGQIGYPYYPTWALNWCRSPMAHHTVHEIQPFEKETSPIAWHVTDGPRIAEAGVEGHSQRLLAMLPFREGEPAFVDVFRLNAGLEEYTWGLRGRSGNFALTGAEVVEPHPLEKPFENGASGLHDGAFEATWRFIGDGHDSGLHVVFPVPTSQRIIVAESPPEQDALERVHLAGDTFKPGTTLPMRAHLLLIKEGPEAVFTAVHLPFDGDAGASTGVTHLPTADPGVIALRISRGGHEYLFLHNPEEGRVELEGATMEGRIGVIEWEDGTPASLTMTRGTLFSHGDVRMAGPPGTNHRYVAGTAR